MNLSRLKRIVPRLLFLCRVLWKDIKGIIGNMVGSSASGSGLIILDDIFPHVLSAFRVVEYNSYLNNFPDSSVHSTGKSFFILGGDSKFSSVLQGYEKRHPEFKGRVVEFNRKRNLHPTLFYVMFLNGASRFIDLIEKYDSPFVFTLYPGGGFHLNQPDSDAQLSRICSSPNLTKIIVTQKISYDYLVRNKFVEESKVHLIYGGVFPSHQVKNKSYYKIDRSSLNICFVAHKYMKQGLDKGYDTFLEVAKKICKEFEDVNFYVVGPFDDSDINVEDIKNRIVFYGSQPTEFFPQFYADMDIILSPNVPFVLSPGAFDGFPTGCCIEAALCGVAVFATDVLKQNIAFIDAEELVVIPADSEQIFTMIVDYRGNHTELRELALKGQQAFKRVFDVQTQMKPRLQILSEAMAKNNR